MANFLKRFWGAAVSIAGVLGLYFGAVAVNAAVYFWWTLAFAVAVACVPPAYRYLRDRVSRIRDYSAMVDRHKGEIDRLEKQLAGAEILARTQWKAGVEEGRSQVLGSLLGSMVSPPVLTGVVKLHDDTILLVAQYSPGQMPSKRARFKLVLSSVQEGRGVVEVVHFDATKLQVFLKRCDESSPTFWDHLRGRVDYDGRPPPDVELVPYPVEERIDSLKSILSNGFDGDAVVEGS